MLLLRCILSFAVLFFLAQSSFGAQGNQQVKGYNILVESESRFCSFLPPKPGSDVAKTEKDGVPFCTQSGMVDGAHQFPAGFIVSAHFQKTSTYSQVTGRIDRSKYKLSASDGGGQYDQKDIIGGTCNNHKFWVNVVEPDSNIFCIRCCSNTKDCNLGISQYGCRRIVPGNYD
ncbi:uncharacterized protein BYT42DRAFT_504340 [Radiomyces spectabilis]|uniref:uncharacterized protein n=1 Tax=Radiomyces spectabilis TaxID=64574 RepID=UPI00221F1D13|nr:uncharacterized protein BYT42DRAFT_504340 [Radiomyces spectabilis]KAI8367481.1 hypothetical protein BYT42DRAFT_504340 [Radiomyces spectabilis]